MPHLLAHIYIYISQSSTITLVTNVPTGGFGFNPVLETHQNHQKQKIWLICFTIFHQSRFFYREMMNTIFRCCFCQSLWLLIFQVFWHSSLSALLDDSLTFENMLFEEKTYFFFNRCSGFDLVIVTPFLVQHSDYNNKCCSSSYAFNVCLSPPLRNHCLMNSRSSIGLRTAELTFQLFDVTCRSSGSFMVSKYHPF